MRELCRGSSVYWFFDSVHLFLFCTPHQTKREVEAVLYVLSHLNPPMASLSQPNVARPTSGLSIHVEPSDRELRDCVPRRHNTVRRGARSPFNVNPKFRPSLSCTAARRRAASCSRHVRRLLLRVPLAPPRVPSGFSRRYRPHRLRRLCRWLQRVRRLIACHANIKG
jgi:hypothetical protein